MTTTFVNPASTQQSQRVFERRPVDRLLAPLENLAADSDHFFNKTFGSRTYDEGAHTLPRYLYLGARGGGEPIRLGIFAAIHGNEPEGALAISRFITLLERNPDIARGYVLFIYPLCNPTGFEDGTRHSRGGRDLNREFWKNSAEPEIRFLESEICLHAFDGIITLHSDDTSDGLYGFVGGAVLTENLIEPALREAEQFLPRNKRRVIDGFSARRGIITDSYPGVLKSIPGLPRPPFEITLETPQKAPLHRQVEAFNAALKTILIEYRYLIAIAQNI